MKRYMVFKGLSDVTDGYAYISYNHYSVESFLNTFLHEVLHLMYPEWSEGRIEKAVRVLLRESKVREWVMRKSVLLLLKGRLRLSRSEVRGVLNRYD